MQRLHVRRFLTLIVVALSGCDDSEQAGSACTMASQCYPDVVDHNQVHGQIVCLTQYPGGYCTHLCAVDTDCCAVAGECLTGFKQLCSPFENQPEKYCFLSCEDADIAAAPNGGTTDPTAYCQRYAGSSLSCRSTGGGTLNRKFCG